MVSVERLMAYGKLPPEASLETIPASNKPDKDWPREGSIKMDDLKFRYSPEDPLVLKGITCEIASSEKVWYRRSCVHVTIKFGWWCVCYLGCGTDY